jgi:hypothetical protein
MNLYSIALFVHVIGAVLVFVLLTVEGVGLRSGSSAAQLGRTLGPLSALAILVPGFYMAAQTGWYAWTAAGLGAYAVIASLGAYTGIGVMRGKVSRRAATLSLLVRAGLSVGVLFDMTVKPELFVAVAALVAGAALAAAVPTVRLARIA